MEATDALSPSGPRWRLLGLLVVGGLVAWLLVHSRGQLGAASTAMRSAPLVALIGCALAGIAGAANLAALQWRTQQLVGVQRAFPETWRLTLGAHALDMASKSGGLAGATRFAADAGGRGHSRERGAVGYLVAELGTHLGLTAVLALLIPWGIATRHTSGADLVAVGVYVTTTALLVGAACAGGRSERLVDAASRPIRWLRTFGRRRRAEERTERVTVAQCHAAMASVRGRRIWPSAMHAALWPVCGAALFAAACLAAGVRMTPPALVFVYAVVTAFSIVGLLPGGLGFAEISMGASLHAFGVDAGHALAAIAVYRLFDLWLPLAIGLGSLRLRRHAGTPAGT